ncbi:MAG: NYN domain-containing protein [Calditrichaeota bacterium]|nr:NYN domain-containing protein [Calditrichota bacterium]
MYRIAILIDGNNFYKGCQLNFSRTDIDFRKFGLKICNAVGGDLLRIYYYNAHVSKTLDPLGYQRQQKFFDNLRATQFVTLKLGHLVYHRLRSEQGFSSQYFPTEKGIDVQIAVDMVRFGLLKSCEAIVLVSGDSDYIYAVRFAKDLGCNIFVASFPLGGSRELQNEGDGHILLDRAFIQDCLIRSDDRKAKSEEPRTKVEEAEEEISIPPILPIEEEVVDSALEESERASE